MHYTAIYLTSQGAMFVLYWVTLTDGSSKLISTGISVFSDLIGFC